MKFHWKNPLFTWLWVLSQKLKKVEDFYWPLDTGLGTWWCTNVFFWILIVFPVQKLFWKFHEEYQITWVKVNSDSKTEAGRWSTRKSTRRTEQQQLAQQQSVWVIRVRAECVRRPNSGFSTRTAGGGEIADLFFSLHFSFFPFSLPLSLSLDFAHIDCTTIHWIRLYSMYKV